MSTPTRKNRSPEDDAFTRAIGLDPDFEEAREVLARVLDIPIGNLPTREELRRMFLLLLHVTRQQAAKAIDAGRKK